MDTTIEILELRALASVVERRSFTAAAEALETDKAHISRIVSRLEEKLGARLLERSTRRLNVTEVGREFYERASGILLALAETEAAVAKSLGKPAGILKLTAGPEFGLSCVNNWIAEYLKTFPDVRVEAEFTNRIVDIIHEGFDVAVRIGSLPDSELSARKLGELDYAFYASPAYLKGRKAPKAPADLSDHDLIMFAPRGRPVWQLVKEREATKIDAEPRYAVNNNQAAMDMAVAGLGVVMTPIYMAEGAVASGALRQVLPGWSRIPVPVHAVFASSRYMTPKVRAFVDLAAQAFV